MSIRELFVEKIYLRFNYKSMIVLKEMWERYSYNKLEVLPYRDI